MSPSDEPHTRALRACMQCKAKKLRCERSDDSPSVCLRCSRLNKDCTLPEIKTRKSSSKVTSRLDLLEQTYGGIVQLLSERQGARPTKVTDTPRMSYLAPASPLSASNASPQTDTGMTGSLHPPLSLADAEGLLEYYKHSLQEHLPLTLVHKDHTLTSLHKESPCLLLAILTVSSWKRPSLQPQLETLLLHNFAARYFEQGENSLDMLQSLIVYICWIQFAGTSQSNHAYRLISSAITVVVDLGLDKPPDVSTEHDRCQGSQSMRDAQSPRTWNMGARRAFVGTFLLAAMCTVSLRKETAMRYSEYVEECALSLAECPETSYDISWVHFVRLARIGMEIKETLTWRQDSPSCAGDDEINMLVKSFEQKISGWRTSLPASVAEHATSRIACSVRYAAMYEVGIYSFAAGQPLSPSRITLLFKCIDSIRNIIYTTLSLPLATLEVWSALNWRHLKYAVMLGSKIAINIDSVACDNESASRVSKLDIALEQLSARVASLLTLCKNPAGQTHYYQQLYLEWQQMRKLYQPAKERLAGSMEYVGGDTSVGEAPDFVQPFTYAQSVPAAPDTVNSMPAIQCNFLGNMNEWTQDGFWLTPENCEAASYLLG